MLITAKDKEIKNYYQEMAKIQNHDNEGNQAPLFLNLLRYATSKKKNFKLVEQFSFKANKKTIRPDATIFDNFDLPIGYFEAKDVKDNLREEIYKKINVAGYPSKNILFQSAKEAILIQHGKEIFNFNIENNPENIALIINSFIEFEDQDFSEWYKVAEEFQERVPQLAKNLKEIIQQAKTKNKEFIKCFSEFHDQLRESINPNISVESVEEMLIQHILTERIFRKVFNNSDFRENNTIAREIEKVIKSLTSNAFNRDLFFKDVEYFYKSLEKIANEIDDFSQKQTFLNHIYENFFQSFSEKTADTHGIVYTPQPVVKFMIKSVNQILQEHFNKNLAHKDVHIIDPFVGTGNFIINLMKEIHSVSRLNFEHKYLNELHCNEIMLLPYYIACMNIEHEFLELTGNYKPFYNICLVDTFELSEAKQMPMFSQENTERIKHQKESDIFVVIGNPPYNAHQTNENDNNKNRKYETLDKRVKETYTSDSKATNKNALSDMYVKAFRFATDRLNDDYGIIAYVTNNSFIDGIAFDGMRKHLAQDFDEIYIVDLKGNIRKNQDSEGGNIFDIMVGVSIMFLIKIPNKSTDCKLFYTSFDYAKKDEKLNLLEQASHFRNLEFTEIIPNAKNNWLYDSSNDDFDNFMPMGTKEGKAGKSSDLTLFKIYSNGVKTNRDNWCFNFNQEILIKNISQMIDFYNFHVNSYNGKDDIDEFVNHDNSKISWSRDLKLDLRRKKLAYFEEDKLKTSTYRPFTKQFLFFDPILNEEIYSLSKIFPAKKDNLVICITGIGSRIPFSTLISKDIVNLSLFIDSTQCFPLYTYTAESGEQVCNIPNATISHLNTLYRTSKIDAETIFYYVYGLLHHEGYKSKYQANLRIELPRIPFVEKLENFEAISTLGKQLAELHLNYEDVKSVLDNWKQQVTKIPDHLLNKIDNFVTYFSYKNNNLNDSEAIKINTEKNDFEVTKIPDHLLNKIDNFVTYEYRYLDLVENPNAQLDLKVSKMKYSKENQKIIYNNFLTIQNIPQDVDLYQLGNKSALEWIIDQYQVKQDKRSGIINDPNNEEQPRYILDLIENIINLSLVSADIMKKISFIKL